jgi:hypothetical protein
LNAGMPLMSVVDRPSDVSLYRGSTISAMSMYVKGICECVKEM